jgi:hypothetical protein
MKIDPYAGLAAERHEVWPVPALELMLFLMVKKGATLPQIAHCVEDT